jgi:hypothetical protein
VRDVVRRLPIVERGAAAPFPLRRRHPLTQLAAAAVAAAAAVTFAAMAPHRESVDPPAVQATLTSFDTGGAGQAPVRPAALPTTYRAPSTLRGGYKRVGVYRSETLVQVLYADGEHVLSVFEQPGQLDWDRMPPKGQAVTVAGHPARSYETRKLRLVTWQGGESAYTVVGDATADEVLAAAEAFPESRHLSTAQRLRAKCRRLVEEISGRR